LETDSLLFSENRLILFSVCQAVDPQDALVVVEVDDIAVLTWTKEFTTFDVSASDTNTTCVNTVGVWELVLFELRKTPFILVFFLESFRGNK